MRHIREIIEEILANIQVAIPDPYEPTVKGEVEDNEVEEKEQDGD